MGNIIQQTTQTKTDKNGEILETNKEQIIRYPKTEDFIMTFTKDLGYMQNLSKGEIMVMFGLLKYVNNQNEIIINKSIKERIAEEFNLKIESMNQLISNLKKKKMVLNVERGIYLLNTHLFGKGKWNEVKKMRMYVEWDFKSQTKKMFVEQESLNEQELLDKQIEQQKRFLEELEKKQTKNEQNETKSLFEEN